MSDLRTSLLRHKLPNKSLKSRSRNNDCTPVKWSKYFENERDVIVKNNKFHIYTKGNTGPLLIPLHGGGYNALTWALFVEEITRKIECQVVAIDLRGHGNTETDSNDMSLETLAKDVIDVVEALYGDHSPTLILVGHSMGGAVAVQAASQLPNASGLCVIDVVEGTALDSLSSMQSILRGRPKSFKSLEQAILWSYKSGQTHNLEAARVSMPGQIKNKKTGILAASECDSFEKTSSHAEIPMKFAKIPMEDAISEEAEEDNNKNNGESSSSKPPLPHSNGCEHNFQRPDETESSYIWRINLSETESFWTGWFKGLSQKFLEIPIPKVLLLANIQGLDTALTIGQMQGKFQMQVLARSGHAIHEDQPGHVADVIAGFLVKQQLAQAKEGFTPLMPAC